MSRYYAIQTWVGSHENEPEYSGQQCGNRKSQSHFIGTSANIAAYAEESPANAPKKPVEKRSAFDRTCLADSRLSKLQALAEALQDDLENGSLCAEDYAYAMRSLQPRIDRAWKQIEKNRRWEEDPAREGFSISFDEVDKEIQLENSLRGDGTSSTFLANVMESLSEANVFKRAYTFSQKAYKILKFVQETLKG